MAFMPSTHIQTIAILGKGNVGQALAAAWRKAGFDVLSGVREPSAPDERFQRAACATADVVVLAVPYDAIDAVLAEIGECHDKIVVDCTNPLAMTPAGLELTVGFTSSGGEEIQRKLPGARLVKTLNQTGAENMAHAGDFGDRPCMFVAGDDPNANAVVSGLVEAIGFSAIDAGPLKNARLIEPLAMLWIDQAFNRGAGRAFALARLRREPATPS